MPPKSRPIQDQKVRLAGNTDSSGMDMQRVQTHKQKNPLAKGVSSSVALGDGGEEPINIEITERTGSLHQKNLKEGGRSSECTTASKR